MRTHRGRLIAVAMSVAIIGAAVRAGATAFDPFTPALEVSVREFKPGDTVSLFHSGTALVSVSLKVGDLLEVHRNTPDGRSLRVGVIRAAAFLGPYCLRGEVVEGRVLPLDVAEGRRVMLLVIPETLCRK